MNTTKMNIRDLSLEDRPREKLSTKGRNSLSPAELIAIQLGSGNVHQNAVELAKQILKSVNNDLNQLAKLSIQDLTKFKGVGEAKAINIISALELGRRREPTSKAVSICASQTAYEVIKPHMMDLDHEQFWIILLNKANVVIKCIQISKGGTSGTYVDTKLIYKEALQHLAVNIILCHNHPSGNSKPSRADIQMTDKIVKAGKLLDIQVLDHIIYTDHLYYSFSDNNRI